MTDPEGTRPMALSEEERRDVEDFRNSAWVHDDDGELAIVALIDRLEAAEARQVPAGWKVEWAYTPHLDDTSGNKVTLSSAPRLVPVTEGGLDD